MNRLDLVREDLCNRPRTWLITGAAGFIGSNLLEYLLKLGQHVTALDNFSTGYRANLKEAIDSAGPDGASRFRFIEGDIRDLDTCREACKGAEFVLHQAALGSVPRSIQDPITTNAVNADGFLNMLVAARDAGSRRLVYASSSSVYGDHPALPKVEDQVGRALSPYAITKRTNELYAQVASELYGIETIGLRYFNVFGRRQDPRGAYAAVIPRWIGRLLSGQECEINGDGETSRDFCYISNVVQANILAALAPSISGATNNVFNVACGDRTTLNELHRYLVSLLEGMNQEITAKSPRYLPFRVGDVRHSLADVSKAKVLLGYEPEYTVERGLEEALSWYVLHQERWGSAPDTTNTRAKAS